ncbi:MAG: hypothetical protein IT436_12995 [Phycisphaerales bacterium]|nr:hypothetical protein [Phycisphaerales bacterium]
MTDGDKVEGATLLGNGRALGRDLHIGVRAAFSKDLVRTKKTCQQRRATNA